MSWVRSSTPCRCGAEVSVAINGTAYQGKVWAIVRQEGIYVTFNGLDDSVRGPFVEGDVTPLTWERDG